MENWLFNVLIGKIVARACVTLAAWVASSSVQAALAHFGVHGVTIDPVELNTGAVMAAHAGYEAFKHWRQSPPPSVPLPNQS